MDNKSSKAMSAHEKHNSTGPLHTDQHKTTNSVQFTYPTYLDPENKKELSIEKGGGGMSPNRKQKSVGEKLSQTITAVAVNNKADKDDNVVMSHHPIPASFSRDDTENPMIKCGF